MAGRKGRKKKEKVSTKTIVISIAIIILLVAIALVVFYVSNGNSFDGILDFFIGSSKTSETSESYKEDNSEEFELIETSKDQIGRASCRERVSDLV